MELSRKAIPYTPVKKSLNDLTIMIVSTSGVHLKDQEPYNVDPSEGDSSYRVIPGDVNAEQLTVTHAAPKEHYNTDAPKEDINCVFPIDRLREKVDAGDLGGIAEKHITMMGYSMRLNKINKETIPAIAKEVVRSKADAVLLTAGWPLCHRTVVTVQRGIEAQGIPTSLITLDVEQSSLMRPPRAIHPKGFEFGHSLGKPNDKATQMKVLEAALDEIMLKQEPGHIHELEFSSYEH